jgi:signal transduction histidine kinase
VATQTPDVGYIQRADTNFARLVCVLAALLYPTWGIFCLHVIPGAVERLEERFAVAALALIVLGLSYMSKWVARRLPELIYVVYAVLTAHYLYIVWHNHFAPMYVIGTFITVTAVTACLDRIWVLVAYALGVLGGVAFIGALSPEAGALGPFLVFGLFTTELLMGVSLQARLVAQAKLARANAELRQADRYKDDFLAIISHELRTPLNAVLGFGSVLQDEVAGPLNANQHAYLGKILASADALLGLVTDLLDMSRVQAGKFVLEPRSTTFQEVAAGVLTRLTPMADRGGQTLVDRVPADLPPLLADPQRVDQILTNLVGNALKFTGPGDQVELTARMEGAALRCEVRDAGDGIPPEHLDKLFLPFSQLDSGRTRKAGGTGLGLSICKALVEAHGGSIGVDSVPGGGSTFWFTLPLDQV